MVTGPSGKKHSPEMLAVQEYVPGGAAGLAPSFNRLALLSSGDEETRCCGMTGLTQWWVCLGNELNSHGFFRFISWSLVARYQLFASAAVARAGLRCLGHASSSTLVLGVSLTAASPCCRLMGKGEGQQAEKCVTVLYRGSERTFVFVTLSCFAAGIVTSFD